MLTFETLRECVSKEKTSSKLTELPENFFHDIRAYLENKEKVSQGRDDMWELDNSKRMLQDLLDSRESKLVKLALVFVRAGVTPGKILPDEKEFFDKMVESIKIFQDARRETVEGKREELETLAVMEDVPKFVGVNMKEYGPFKKGEVVRIPKDNSQLLISKGMGRLVEGK
jgi:DNA replication factor GINS